MQQQQQQTIPVGASTLPPQLQQQLLQIEQLAQRQFNGDIQADALLSRFRTDAACIAQSRWILDHSTNDAALALAASSLKQLLTTFFHTFTGAETLEIRNYLLNYVANACNAKMERYVIKELVETTARITKLGWRQDPNAPAGQLAANPPGGPSGAMTLPAQGHASFVELCKTFFQHSMRHHQCGLLLLTALVQDMEHALPVESPSDHRKTSRLFRDHALLDIVRIAMNELHATANFVRAGEPPSEIERLLSNSLYLFSSCLNFDFIGSAIDETAQDDSNITLQVPSSWRPLVEDQSQASPCLLLAHVMDEYKLTAVQAEVLNAFTCLSSVRRSLFSSDEARWTFMKFLMDFQCSLVNKVGTKTQALMTTQNGGLGDMKPILADDQNYHEFTRFVARFKYNYSLNDLIRNPSFPEWLQTMCMITVNKGFQDYDTEGGSANSLSFLLGFWSRIASDVSQLKSAIDGSSAYTIATQTSTPQQPQPITHTHQVQNMILEIIPKICELFINARLDSITKRLMQPFDESEADEIYNEIFAEPNLSDQLKHMSVLGRFHYIHIKTFVKSRFESLVEQYTALLSILATGVGAPQGMMLPSGMMLGPNGQQLPQDPQIQFRIIECQLSMLIYVIGALVGSEKSLLILHGQHMQHVQSYPWLQGCGALEKMNTRDHLELIDAELFASVIKLLPIMNARIERTSQTASAYRQHGVSHDAITALNQSRSHMAKGVLYFFGEFRKKYLNAIAHLNFGSYSTYSRSGIISALVPPEPSPSPNGDDMESTTATPTQIAIPSVDMICHGPSANIFSRVAFFLQAPFTPQNALQILVKQFLIFLNYLSHDLPVFQTTLEIFDALSVNYATSAQLAQIDEIRQFLQNSQVLGTSMITSNGNQHQEVKGMSLSTSTLAINDMHFLHSTAHPKELMTFYQILSRLVFKGQNIDYFPQFITPFTHQLKQLESLHDLTQLQKNNMLDQVVLLIYKLHGVVTSIQSSVVYHMFWEWFFEANQFGSLVIRLVETFWEVPEVAYPILSFYSEFIWNRSQRIRFDTNSPNGIILFKETFKIISTYVQRMMLPNQDAAVPTTSNELYDRRLKGISKVLLLVSNSLSGNYVNTGIMAYYQDTTLKQCLAQALTFAMSVRFPHIINHPKVATNYYQFIEVIFKNHLDVVCEISDTSKFLAIISSLHEGLLSVHHQQVMLAASALEALMQKQWEWNQPLQKAKQTTNNARLALERHLTQSATLIPEILCTLFNINLFDDMESNWTLSRPIFGILICHPDSLNFYKQRLLSAQTLPTVSQSELAAKIQAASERLMAGLSQKFSHTNKEKFSSNLVEFRENITQFCTRPM